MKKQQYIPVFLLFLSTSVFSQGIEFFHGTWAEALQMAKSDEKLIFVDAFASWCGPCKRMATQTFPDQSVGDFFNANFICMKIDMEKPENAEFAGKYPVGSYPTLMFIDAEGKLVMKDIGAKTVDQLLETGRKALGKNDRSEAYEQKYNDGNRDPKFLYDYVRSLNLAGKQSLKITNEYLNTQQDLSTEFNLKFILEGATDADSRVFDLLLKNRDKIVAVTGEDAVNTKIERACKKTVSKAVAFKNKDLLEEAKTKLKNAVPSRAAYFAYESDMGYAKAVKDPAMFLKTAQTYQKTEVKNNASKLNELAITLVRTFPEDKKSVNQAEKWAKTAAENGGLAEYWMTLAGIYKMQGNTAKARSTAETAKKALTEKDAMLKDRIQMFLDDLN